jgi:hypothetical protein
MLTPHYMCVRGIFHGVRDSAVFAEVTVLQRKPRAQFISIAALEVHVRAIAQSAGTDSPAFVGYTDLDAIAPGPVSTMAAVELCLAKLWVQSVGGYVVTDTELIERMSTRSLDPWSRRAALRLTHSASRALRRIWRVLNEERFIPL